MIWKIAKKEFLLNLMTFRFAVGTALCVGLVALFTFVLVGDYHQRLESYSRAVAKNADELRQVRVYSQIRPTVYRPPQVLSVFSEGMEKQLGSAVTIERGKVPEITAGYISGNPLLSIFPSLDISLIFKVVLSILALLFAYDAISGEKEQGTLKLMLSGTVARHQVLLGKLLAGLLTLVIPITIAFIVGLSILQFSPMVGLTGSDWVRIGLIYLVSLIFVSAMFLFGLWFSCLTKKSSTTLMLVLFFWVIFAFVIPNGSVYLAAQFRKVEPREGIDVKVMETQEEFHKKLSNFRRENRPMVPKSVSQAGESLVVLYAPKSMMRYYQNENALFEPLRIEVASEAWDLEQRYFNRLKAQKNLGEVLSVLSPISVYEGVMSGLLGTDLGNYEQFIENVRRYRNQILAYYRSEKRFSSLAFFTVQKEKDLIDVNEADLNALFLIKMVQETGIPSLPPEELEQLPKHIRNRFLMILEEMKRGRTPRLEDVIHPNTLRFMKLFREKSWNIEDFPPLDLRDFPRFTYQPEKIAESIGRVLPRLGLLIFINVLFFLLAFTAFLRYDAR